VPILGSVDRLAELIDQSRATDLVIALKGRPAGRLMQQLSDPSGPSGEVRVHWVEDVLAPPGEDAFFADPTWTVGRRSLNGRIQRAAKRLGDFLGAAVGLLLLTPLFLVVSALILITSGRPVFYTQDRIGHGGRLFRILK